MAKIEPHPGRSQPWRPASSPTQPPAERHPLLQMRKSDEPDTGKRPTSALLLFAAIGLLRAHVPAQDIEQQVEDLFDQITLPPQTLNRLEAKMSTTFERKHRRKTLFVQPFFSRLTVSRGRIHNVRFEEPFDRILEPTLNGHPFDQRRLAEANGNRTRQGPNRPLTGFEDRGTHQASRRLPDETREVRTGSGVWVPRQARSHHYCWPRCRNAHLGEPFATGGQRPG